MADKKSNRKIFIIGGVAAVIMFGFSFAMVPLYNLICKKIGVNTSIVNSGLLTPDEAAASSKKNIDLSRSITVQFVATNHNGMPWDFYPRVKSIEVHPGENNKITFYAKNTTSKKMTVQDIPSMTPTDALSHFHKIECFCFNQQTLDARESRDMALVFQIDKDLPKEIKVITLSYTLFDATPKEKTRKG
jgi:cytochrome c oxidase assembly protein subunit 11